MNSVIFLPLLSLMVFFTFNNVDASMVGHPMDFWKSADFIFDGTVKSTTSLERENLIRYNVEVNQFFKNNLSQQLISVYVPLTANEQWPYSKFFNSGDRALFYLQKIGDKYFILDSSIKATEQCLPRDMIGLSTLPGEGLARGGPILFFNPYQTCNPYLVQAGMIRNTMSPIKQIQSGIVPGDIGCDDDDQLMFSDSGSVACVRKSSVLPLMKRGWTHVDNQEHLHFKTALPTIFLDVSDKMIIGKLDFVIEIMDLTKNNNHPTITIMDKNQNIEWIGQLTYPFNSGWQPFGKYVSQYKLSDYPEKITLKDGTYMLSISLCNQKITKQINIISS